MSDTKTVALTCNNCGAALSLAEDVRFFTCSHCGARLEIQRTSDAIYTKVLEKVSQVERVANDAAAEILAVKAERSLEKLDAELAELHDPGGWFAPITCGAFALLGLILAFSNDPEKKGVGIMNLVVFGGFTLLFSYNLPKQQRAYQASRSAILKRREFVIQARHDALPASESSVRTVEPAHAETETPATD